MSGIVALRNNDGIMLLRINMIRSLLCSGRSPILFDENHITHNSQIHVFSLLRLQEKPKNAFVLFIVFVIKILPQVEKSYRGTPCNDSSVMNDFEKWAATILRL